MREIKFRAWDIVNNRMYHHFDFPDQYLIGLDGTVWDTKAHDSFGLGLGSTVDCFKLLQFTGLKDKKGVEIYEGDILSICNGSINGIGWPEKNREVKFEKGSFNVPTWSQDSTHYFEVIGNIHQHPDLLK